MLSPDLLARSFFDCLDKGAITLFRSWLALHKGINKWLIGADFALRDRSRAGDCFAFTVYPYKDWPNDIMSDVKAHLPHDLKDVRRLDERSSEWLRDLSDSISCFL